MQSKHTSCLCAAAVAMTATAAVAHAGGAFSHRHHSTYGGGTSYAGIAAGGSLSAMFWNPATLADVGWIEGESVTTVIFPTSEVTVDPIPALGFTGSDHDPGSAAIIPVSYAAYRLDDRTVLGISFDSPYGQVTRYKGDTIVEALGVAGRSEALTLTASPAIAVDVTDWLTVAAGLQFQYFEFELTDQFLGPLGISRLEGDDIGFGFTAGARITPMPGTEIGIGYRSGIDHELEGKLKSPIAGTFDVTYDDLDLPDMVTLGIRQRITDRLRVMAGVEWTNWSRLDAVNIEDGPAPIPLAFDYEDSWYFSAGAEYDATPELMVRAGVGRELTPIDAGVRTYRLPYNDAWFFSAGASYRFNDRYAFDIAYIYIAVDDMTLRAAGAGGGPDANGPLSGEAESDLHVISAALKINFSGP